MKYLKLFENFDRYEFGEFTNTEENRLKIEYIDKNRVDFTTDELDIIIDKLSSCEHIEYESDMVEVRFVAYPNEPNDYDDDFFRIYSLGDYCYAASQLTKEFDYETETESIEYSRLWILDEIEDLENLLEDINNFGK